VNDTRTADPKLYRLTMPLGLPEPETAAGVIEAGTIDGMRAAIRRGSYDSALIRASLMAAEHRGLSGEDTYVMLAYHALIALEKASSQVSKLMMMSTK